MGLAVHEQLIEQNAALLIAQLPDPILFPNLAIAQVWTEIPANIPSGTLPAVVFTIVGVNETYEAIDEFNDAVTRPVVCAIVRRTDPRFANFRPDFLTWRQSLIRLFRGQGIRKLVSNITVVFVDTDAIIDEASVPREYFVSGFVLNHRSIEPRGL